jgi:hypothetical protein
MSAASALLLLMIVIVLVIVIVGFRRSSRSPIRAWGNAPRIPIEITSKR